MIDFRNAILSLLLLAVPSFAAEEPIIPSGFTESDYLRSCPINTAGCATTYNPETSGDEGKMRFICKDSHYSYEDPIIFPGGADSTHLHMFFGNPHTTKDSTFASLRANVDLGTCAGGPLNNTGYWAPAMIRPQSNEIVKPDFIEFYYTVPRGWLTDHTSPVCLLAPGSRNLQDGRPAACPMLAVQRIERGMKAIFGFRPSSGTFPLQGIRNFAWSCTDGSSPDRAMLWHRSTPALGVQSCPTNTTVQVRMGTPECWDGNYDSADHYTHLAWPSQDGYGTPVCPLTHPKRIPQLTIIIAWKHFGQADYSQWYLSSDRFNGANYEAGQSFHTDAYWAWSQNVMDAWTGEMLGIPSGGTGVKIGSDGPLGNGTNMLQYEIGITAAGQAPGRYVAIPTRAHGYHRVRVNVSPVAPKLVDSEPGANEQALIHDNQIYLEFDQSIDPKQSSVHVTDAQGRVISYELSQNAKDPKVLNVQLKPSTVMGYEAGHYTVKWSTRVLSGGSAQGEFGFHVRSHH